MHAEAIPIRFRKRLSAYSAASRIEPYDCYNICSIPKSVELAIT